MSVRYTQNQPSTTATATGDDDDAASRMTSRALVGVPSRQLRDCVTNMGAGARIHVRESC